MISDVSVGLRTGEAYASWPRVPNSMPYQGSRMRVRIRSDRGDIPCFWSSDGKTCSMFQNSTAVTGARSLALYAAGEGEVVFRNFIYRGLD